MPTRQAECHPDKKNFGGGRCANCYYRHRYKKDKKFRLAKLARNRAGSLRTTLEQRRAWKLKYKYGITAGQYAALLERQGGVCAACKEPPSGWHRFLVVDHDHSCCPGRRSCGQCIRALLHSECNVIIGAAREDSEVLRKLAEYVKKRKPSGVAQAA
jgi:hypothetical protein